MKFPITKESLQGFNYAKEVEEQAEETIQKEIASVIQTLCKDFTMNLCANSGRNDAVREKRYVWRNLPRVARFYDKFIEKLGDVFVDCNFIVDPLKTYLIIDWS